MNLGLSSHAKPPEESARVTPVMISAIPIAANEHHGWTEVPLPFGRELPIMVIRGTARSPVRPSGGSRKQTPVPGIDAACAQPEPNPYASASALSFGSIRSMNASELPCIILPINLPIGPHGHPSSSMKVNVLPEGLRWSVHRCS